MNHQDRISKAEVLDAITRHRGAANGVHVNELVSEIRQDFLPDSAAERTVRRHVETLQREGKPIAALPVYGYFLIETEEEMNRACDWLYSRAMCSLSRIAGVKRVAVPDIRGQLRMPT